MEDITERRSSGTQKFVHCKFFDRFAYSLEKKKVNFCEFFFINDQPAQHQYAYRDTSTAPVCIPGQREDTKNGGWCAVQTQLRFPKSRYRGHQRELRSEIDHVKWRREYLLRAVREVIFGVGLNQMSEYFSDRIAVVHHHPNLTSR